MVGALALARAQDLMFALQLPLKRSTFQDFVEILVVETGLGLRPLPDETTAFYFPR